MQKALLLLMIPAALSAQTQTPAQLKPFTPPPTPRAISAIREADIKRDLFAMASPAMRGREGGTLDEMIASVWVADQYKKVGL